jgi:ankyrin repeat protein
MTEAAAQGWTDGVDYLLKKKHPVDKPSDMGGLNPLLHAAKNGYYKTCKFLIANGAFPDIVDNNRYNALMHAVKRKCQYFEHVQAVQEQLRGMWFKTMEASKNTKKPKSAGKKKRPGSKGKGAGTKTAKEPSVQAPKPMFGTANVPEHNKIVKFLIKQKSNVNHRDRWGRNVLSHAAEAGNRQACQMLVRAGARLDEVDNEKRSPLHWALSAGRSRVARLLVQMGCALNIQDVEGHTPLMMCAKMNKIKDALYLNAAGADKNLKTGHGYTALQIASFHDFIELETVIKTQSHWAKENYKIWRRERREKRRADKRRADQLIQLEKERKEQEERERIEKEKKKKKKRKGGGKPRGKGKSRPGSPSKAEKGPDISMLMNNGPAPPTKKEKKVQAESDVSSEPESSDFEHDFEGKQY